MHRHAVREREGDKRRDGNVRGSAFNPCNMNRVQADCFSRLGLR